MARAMTGLTRRANARVRAARPRVSKAGSPRVNLGRAASGFRVGQANGRAGSASTSFVPTPSRTRNSPKAPGRPTRSVNLHPRAGKVSSI